jgi:hypothetical protein
MTLLVTLRPPRSTIFSHRPDEGGTGGTYLPWANRPGVAATPTYLPKMRHTHPTLPPTNPKSSVEAACGSKLVASRKERTETISN